MTQIGTKKIQTPNGPRTVPVHDPADVSNPWWRVVTASGIGAVPVVALGDADSDEYRVVTDDGIYALDSTTGGGGATVVDGFEDDSFSEYTGEVSAFGTTTSESYSGDQSVVKTGGNAHTGMYLTAEQFSASSSKEVAVRYLYQGSEHRGGVYLADSTSGAGYVGYVNPGGGYEIDKVTGTGTWDSIVKSTGSALSLTSGEWYYAVISHDGGDGLSARLEDDSGTTIAGPISATDAGADPDTVGIWMYDQDMILDDLSIL